MVFYNNGVFDISGAGASETVKDISGGSSSANIALGGRSLAFGQAGTNLTYGGGSTSTGGILILTGGGTETFTGALQSGLQLNASTAVIGDGSGHGSLNNQIGGESGVTLTGASILTVAKGSSVTAGGDPGIWAVGDGAETINLAGNVTGSTNGIYSPTSTHSIIVQNATGATAGGFTVLGQGGAGISLTGSGGALSVGAAGAAFDGNVTGTGANPGINLDATGASAVNLYLAALTTTQGLTGAILTSNGGAITADIAGTVQGNTADGLDITNNGGSVSVTVEATGAVTGQTGHAGILVTSTGGTGASVFNYGTVDPAVSGFGDKETGSGPQAFTAEPGSSTSSAVGVYVDSSDNTATVTALDSVGKTTAITGTAGDAIHVIADTTGTATVDASGLTQAGSTIQATNGDVIEATGKGDVVVKTGAGAVTENAGGNFDAIHATSTPGGTGTGGAVTVTTGTGTVTGTANAIYATANGTDTTSVASVPLAVA